MRKIIAITVLVIMASMASAMTIRGTVSDANGPLINASIVEIDENNRPMGNFTVTDVDGHFTLGVTNKKHKIRVRYNGMETVKLKISKKKYRIVMQPKKYNIDIDSFQGIDGRDRSPQSKKKEEPSWRAIPLRS